MSLGGFKVSKRLESWQRLTVEFSVIGIRCGWVSAVENLESARLSLIGKQNPSMVSVSACAAGPLHSQPASRGNRHHWHTWENQL